MILSCESVQTHPHLPITFIEAFQGIPVPHRSGTPGASLRSGVGHTGTPLWIDTSIHTFAHMRTSRSFDFIMWARELQSAPERSCELADRPQTSTHCPHDLLSTSRHSHGRGARTMEHLLLSTSRPRHAPSPAAHASRPQSHARALQPTNTPSRERGGFARGHGRRGRGGGGKGGS